MAHVDFKNSNSLSYIPEWCGQPITQRDLIRAGARLDPNDWPYSGEEVVASAAATAGNAVAVSVNAINFDIPLGSRIEFGPAGGSATGYLTLSAKAEFGATTINGRLVGAIAANDVGIYSAGYIRKMLRSGTLLSRASVNDAYGPADAAHTDFHILAFDVENMLIDPSGTLLIAGKQFPVYMEKLPNWANLSAALQTKVRENYLETTRHAVVFS